MLSLYWLITLSPSTPRQSKPAEQPPILIWSRSGQGPGQPLGQCLAYTTVSRTGEYIDKNALWPQA